MEKIRFHFDNIKKEQHFRIALLLPLPDSDRDKQWARTNPDSYRDSD